MTYFNAQTSSKISRTPQNSLKKSFAHHKDGNTESMDSIKANPISSNKSRSDRAREQLARFLSYANNQIPMEGGMENDRGNKES